MYNLIEKFQEISLFTPPPPLLDLESACLFYSLTYLGFHFRGGGSKYFWKSREFALREARGVWPVRGMLPEKFLKMVQFAAFGKYFAKIL